MKLLGFSIAEDCIALERGEDYFDLHNNFDFSGLTYDPSQRMLELRWRRGIGDWIKPSEASGLRIVFSGVDLFKAHERDPTIPFSEDDCLDSIGFIWNELLNELNCYASNAPGRVVRTSIFRS